ncbi:hypothetical protein CLU96_4560 [Chryseobacterium sp. 52]|uniref:hypothetical protein n=1 Tax=Chryseobacterium sp. 52 TaxID=2035213 RepID=UPI000C1954B6|nr:hypothetical protein [Chryseobacterium sp. 52]PIF47502.1 hypothetical protein CLU96_4560 [Chryseobacterium sp. 52]
MKGALITVVLFFSIHLAFSQKCSCSKNPELKNVISCEATQFENGAKIYWDYDCNSSWITFQNGKIRKKIFTLEKEFIEFTGRLGYRSWTEYKNSFLVENSVVSGCCQPGEYILYNKNNGEKIIELGTIISINHDGNNPYTITLKTDNKLLYTDLNNNKSYAIKIPKNKIESTLKNTNVLYPENLFENIEIKNGLLSIHLRYKESKQSNWKVEVIKLDIKKHSR